jgi:hypothetical protein
MGGVRSMERIRCPLTQGADRTPHRDACTYDCVFTNIHLPQMSFSLGRIAIIDRQRMELEIAVWLAG